MSSPIRAVIFDFDGVIADSEGLHFETFAATLRRAGLDITRAEADRKYIGLSDDRCFEQVLREAGRDASEEERDRLVEQKTALYQANVHRIELCPGARELIEAAGRRYPLAISSSARKDEIELVLRRHEIGQHFPILVSSDDGLASKPHPGPYLKAQELLRASELDSLAPEECLVIEDSPRGIEAAKKAGMQCVAVTHTFPEERLTAADRVVKSLFAISSEWADAPTA